MIAHRKINKSLNVGKKSTLSTLVKSIYFRDESDLKDVEWRYQFYTDVVTYLLIIQLPFDADCSEVDDTCQCSEHLYVADDLADRSGLKFFVE